jgi:hypothetical protein
MFPSVGAMVIVISNPLVENQLEVPFSVQTFPPYGAD